LEKLRKAIDSKIEAKEKEILEVNHNIDMLVTSKNTLLTKQQYLDTTMKVKQTTTVHHNPLSGTLKPTDVSRVHNTSVAVEHHSDDKSAFAML
jgi:hypothetical protein